MEILRDISINRYSLYYIGLRIKLISFVCLHNLAGKWETNNYDCIETARNMIPLRGLPRLLYDTIGS